MDRYETIKVLEARLARQEDEIADTRRALYDLRTEAGADTRRALYDLRTEAGADMRRRYLDAAVAACRKDIGPEGDWFDAMQWLFSSHSSASVSTK